MIGQLNLVGVSKTSTILVYNGVPCCISVVGSKYRKPAIFV